MCSIHASFLQRLLFASLHMILLYSSKLLSCLPWSCSAIGHSWLKVPEKELFKTRAWAIKLSKISELLAWQKISQEIFHYFYCQALLHCFKSTFPHICRSCVSFSAHTFVLLLPGEKNDWGEQCPFLFLVLRRLAWLSCVLWFILYQQRHEWHC